MYLGAGEMAQQIKTLVGEPLWVNLTESNPQNICVEPIATYVLWQVCIYT